jgi:hypothetical protein
MADTQKRRALGLQDSDTKSKSPDSL